MIKNVCTFVNVLVEAASVKEHRLELKETFMRHGLSVVYADIKLKIHDKDYHIEDCS